MAEISPLARAELGEFEPVFRLVEAVMGFVPNSMLTMGRRPELLRAFAGLVGHVLGPGRLPGELKQLVAYVSSLSAGCRYCQAHTSHSAHRQGASPEKIAAAFSFETSPLFDAREHAALALARDASASPPATTPAHFEALRAHFDEEEILELVAVVATFGFLNRWNATMATSLEEEPLGFAREHLRASGWKPGEHAPGSQGRERACPSST